MEIEGRHLGKKSDYPKKYDPSVLVAVPRELNRKQYKIDQSKLPFIGCDVWHAYEFSFLLKKGLPVCGLLKIVYPCDSEFLVESKSLKLYLNSFNMEYIGNTKAEGIALTSEKIKKDLSTLLKCDVHVHFFDHNEKAQANDFQNYAILEDLMENENLDIKQFEENPSVLDFSGETGSIEWGTHLLRSNCKITHQPDWGSLYLQMEGSKLPSQQGFLKYIVSLRNENHFHEEICEMVFVRLQEKYQPEKLSVSCMYTRRGGIDINPVRSTNKSLIPPNLSQQKRLSEAAFRQ